MHITFRSPTHHATHTHGGGRGYATENHTSIHEDYGQILDELDEIHNHIIIHNTTTKGSIYGGEY